MSDDVNLGPGVPKDIDMKPLITATEELRAKLKAGVIVVVVDIGGVLQIASSGGGEQVYQLLQNAMATLFKRAERTAANQDGMS